MPTLEYRVSLFEAIYLHNRTKQTVTRLVLS